MKNVIYSSKTQQETSMLPGKTADTNVCRRVAMGRFLFQLLALNKQTLSFCLE